MPFTKGHKIKGGRPKGSISPKTELRERLIEWYKLKGFDQMIREVEELKGKAFVDATTTLFEYCEAKLARVIQEGGTNDKLEVVIKNYDNHNPV